MMNDDSFSRYIDELKERRPEIAEFHLRCERGHLVSEDYVAMRHTVRKLVVLTETRNGQLHSLARSMQDAISSDNFATQTILLPLSKLLLSACHNALVMSVVAQPSQSYAPPVPLILRGGKPLLISVDDDRIVHHMLDSMFCEYISLLHAYDGAEGFVMIRQHRPDLILLDDAMPSMTGMRLIEKLREEPELANLPVIMLTSSDRPKDFERANAAGATNYLLKPFEPQKLADAVYKALLDITSQAAL